MNKKLLLPVLLAVAAAVAWTAFEWFRPLNRVQRATYKLLEAAPKSAPGPDAPLDLLRAVAPYRKYLAADVSAAVPNVYSLRGRQNALQALEAFRQCSDVIWLDHPIVSARPLSRDAIEVSVEVPFKIRLSRPYRSLTDGHRWDWTLHARLIWTRIPSSSPSWQITSVLIAPFRGEPLP
ncbi:MAG: hypothetical protein IK066_06955 [Kiritimatiellae bacterium]|nr:hypothetical protein [Kiritimatiellia bacterium]